MALSFVPLVITRSQSSVVTPSRTLCESSSLSRMNPFAARSRLDCARDRVTPIASTPITTPANFVFIRFILGSANWLFFYRLCAIFRDRHLNKFVLAFSHGEDGTVGVAGDLFGDTTQEYSTY